MIRYKKYQNQTKSTPLSGKWLARAVADETLDTRALAEHMAKHNTPYSQGAIHGVLKDMTSCIKELLSVIGLISGLWGPQGHDLLHQGVAARRQEREAGRPRHLRRGDPRETCRHVERLVGHYQRGRAAPQMPRHRNPRHQPAETRSAAQGAFTLRHRRWQYRRWRRGGTAGRTLSNRQEKPRETQTKSCVKNFS